IRERFVFSPAESLESLSALRRQGVAREAVLLSTCNRTEFYLHQAQGSGGESAVLEVLASRAGLSVAETSSYSYSHRDQAGVEHLFRVVSSLDSMIVGESQIQGQVRSAYEQAALGIGGESLVGPVLSR